MAFSQDDLDKIEAAIASGALTVKYADKEVTYRSIKDLKEARDLIRRKLGQTNKGGGRVKTNFSKGLVEADPRRRRG